MKYFDAHTHLNFVAYDADREATIFRAREASVDMNIVGTQFDTSASAVALAEKYEGVYATIGLHPIHTGKSYHDEKELGEGNREFTSRGEIFDMGKYLALGKNPKVIAVGECGLDYYRLEEKTKAVQTEAFLQQIELANRLKKPLMLHIRSAPKGSGDGEAYRDALALVKAHAKVLGDVHFFAGDWAIAKGWLDIGFTLSFTGVLTFTNDYDEVVKNAPLDMLLSETDAPYITPVPYRGKRNESSYVPEIVKAIARIRAAELEKVASVLYGNARRVFSIK